MALAHERRLGFGEELLRHLAIDGFAADLQHLLRKD
jgi:hypothetical protein